MVSVRLGDVAAVAGVSVRTVSNVVAGHPNVRAETRDRVRQAIDKLGYMPNVSARRLARGRSGTIAFAIPSVAVPFFAELTDRVIDAATEHGYRVLIEQTRARADRERAVINRPEAGLVDGVLMMTGALTASQITRDRSELPVVLLGEAAVPAGIDHVMIDNVSAAREATGELIRGGATRVVFLGAGMDSRARWIGRGRLAGWQEALEENALAASPERVLETADWTFQNGFDAVAKALGDGVEFDAIFCCEDQLALGALAALATAGVRVPAQVSVTGWDDIQPASFVVPALTTVSPDRATLVQIALDLLVARIEGDNQPAQHVVVPYTVTRRESTRPSAR